MGHGIDRRFLTAGRAAVGTRVSARAAGNGGGRVIYGYAAVFYNPNDPGTEYPMWDDFYERLMPGCFDRALRENDDVLGLFNHNPDNLLGRAQSGTLRLAVDARGLMFELEPPDTELARAVYEFIRRGDVSGCSFSFRADDVIYREMGTVVIREINSVKLFDVGPVVAPAYKSTSVGASGAAPVQPAPDRNSAFSGRRYSPSPTAPLSAKLAAYRARAVEVS